MKTRKIFIDTQAFMQQGFKFEGSVLNRIKKLGRSNLIEIYLSEVVKREVSSKISEKIKEAKKKSSDFIKELSILESETPKEVIDFINLVEKHDLQELALSKWNKFIEDSKAIILDPNDICNIELLSLYFDGKYPFSDGKKKNEFPDAISTLSLKAKMSQPDDLVYVISNDGDLKGFCEKEANFINLSQLSEFLDLYNRAEERLTNIVHEYVDNEIDWISENIKEAFLNSGFTFSANYEAEVDNVIVTGITTHEIDVIEIEEGRVIIGVRCEITCTADISGPDYDTAMWDSEDKEYIFLEYFNANMSFDDVYDISIELFFDEEQGEFTDISSVEFDVGSDIDLYIDDGFPYK
ncbi:MULTISPECIES: PIN domain-containing protein [Halomonadaceae]|uniref:DUF4935 domain-containing protein n=1 Tax=Vreelandella titanicae TaxID=664683 RepID=A0AAP9NL30_9GAMM|nr:MULTISPECIES: PIN domain-containing protein [Halomonas]QKS23545.1 hypothetical protein FX987_01304 [Halomonas titanicae]CDG55215.1 conserved hypothetical protein [Halomonas sp. A3H3]SDI36347.1 hypothetical protein SAMN04487867_10582 [Halomonas titanicae]